MYKEILLENESNFYDEKISFNESDEMLRIEIKDESVVKPVAQLPKTYNYNTSQKINCPNCGVGYDHFDDVQCHQILNKCYKPLRCGLCDSKFATRKSLRKHYIKSVSHKAKIKSSDTNLSLELKVVRPKQENVQPTKQEIKIQRVTCQNCGHRFVDNDDLEYHQNLHQCFKPLECGLCGTTFLTKKSQKKHYKTISHEAKLKTLSNKPTFKIEDKTNKDTNEKQYQCDFCSKSFQLKSVLKEHIRIHTNESRALCSFCGRSFTSKSNLRQVFLLISMFY